MWYVSPIYHLLQLRLMGIFHLMMALEEKSLQESLGCFVLESWMSDTDFMVIHTVVETVRTKVTIEPLTASTWALWGLRCGLNVQNLFSSLHTSGYQLELFTFKFVSRLKTWRWWHEQIVGQTCLFPSSRQTDRFSRFSVFSHWKGKKLKLCKHSARCTHIWHLNYIPFNMLDSVCLMHAHSHS